jgi:hypothetical protein
MVSITVPRCSALLLFLSAVTGCSGRGPSNRPDCIPPPCPLPVAVVLNVSSMTGGPVAALSMSVSGAVVGSGSCSVAESVTVCSLGGGPGTYNIRLTAPGFEEKELSITVTGNTPACACTTVVTQELSVVVSPN